MAVKKSELYGSIWKSCDELRGGMAITHHSSFFNRLRSPTARLPETKVRENVRIVDRRRIELQNSKTPNIENFSFLVYTITV